MRVELALCVCAWIAAGLGCAYDSIDVPPRGPADGDAALDEGSRDTEPDDTGPSDGHSDGGGPDSDAPDGDVAILTDLEVVALSRAAANWNDYALEDDLDTPCPAVSPPTAGCIHAGAGRKLELPKEASCDELEATDERGWFDWTCSADSGAAVFTAQLRSGTTLADLIDIDELRWLTNAVTVTRDGETIGTSVHAPFWQNPVLAVPAASAGAIELDTIKAVYVVTETPAGELRITANGVSLLGGSGVELRAVASSDAVLEVSTGEPAFFLWIENIAVDADDHAAGVDLQALVYSVVHGLTVTRNATLGAAPAVDLRIDATASTITGLRSTSAAGVAIKLAGARNGVSGIEVEGAAGDGLGLQLSESMVSDVRVSGADGAGVRLQGVTRTTLEHISVADCEGDGVLVEASSHNDTFVDLVVSNNGASGIVLGGNDQRLVLSISANNEIEGVRVEGNNSLLMHTTTTSNGFLGINVGGANVEIINALSTNNQGGLWLSGSSQLSRLHDVWLAKNVGGDVRIEGPHNVFSGALAIGASNACSLGGVPGPSEPGLVVSPSCANPNGSTATITFDNPLQTTEPILGMETLADDGVLGGRQRESDPANQPIDPATYQRAYAEISDWFSFSHRQRHWGRPPSSGFFPNEAAVGRCDAASGCAYWDWRVSPRMSRLRDPLGADASTRLAALALPVHARTHVWSATLVSGCDLIPGAQWVTDPEPRCVTHLLAYAYEPYEPLDGFGNDNFLCEDGEICVLNRNRGAYPGGAYPDESQLAPREPGEVVVQGFGSVTLGTFVSNGE